ncbi:MAG: hydantoinase B/oxoprolinase family protein, partial [Acidimicrobiales bacterium]
LEYRTDSAGAGAFRGGLGTETLIRFPAGSDERLYACVQGLRHPPAGIADGGAAAPASVHVTETGSMAQIDAVEQDRPLMAGAEVRIVTPGGGGWGDPRARTQERVRADVLDGYVSSDQAVTVYGLDGGEG